MWLLARRSDTNRFSDRVSVARSWYALLYPALTDMTTFAVASVLHTQTRLAWVATVLFVCSGLCYRIGFEALFSLARSGCCVSGIHCDHAT